jgi:hypothetical protein
MTIFAKGFVRPTLNSGVFPSWFEVFGIMLEMPHLSHLHLSGLMEDHAGNGRLPYYRDDDKS